MAKKRKTKEQKIISELRRKLSLQASSSEQVLRQTQDKLFRQTQMKSSSPEKTIKRGPSFNLPPLKMKTTSNFPVLTPEKSASASAQHNYSYLLKDLKRAAALIGLAIFAQVVLYWLLL